MNVDTLKNFKAKIMKMNAKNSSKVALMSACLVLGSKHKINPEVQVEKYALDFLRYLIHTGKEDKKSKFRIRT